MPCERFSAEHPELSAMRRGLTAQIEDFMRQVSLPSIVAGIVVALVSVNLIEALVGGVIGPVIAAIFNDSRPLQFLSFTIDESEVFYGAVIESALVAIYLVLVRPRADRD